MKNTYKIIPTYTGDVSGVASALYELGGMTVMHDPSGCNSTYNTHDETRWYQEESLIYISGLSEVDAILGNDEKFIRDIVFAAEQMQPEFIALTSAPIPYLNGTDFEGIARVIEKQTGLMTFFVPSNGIHDYAYGAGNAFYMLAKRLFEDMRSDIHRDAPSQYDQYHLKFPKGTKINILGLTPLDYDAPGCLAGMLRQFGDCEIISKWAMGSSLEDLKKAYLADVNVVVSVTGLKTAQYFKQRFGIPYVIGAPVTGFDWEPVGLTSESKVVLIGEPVLMTSLAEKLYEKCKTDIYVCNPLEITLDGETKEYGDDHITLINTEGEEDIESFLSHADFIIADPLYRPVAPNTATFYAMSHEAFSGRCDRKSRVNLFR